jgi:hypothetical protein
MSEIFSGMNSANPMEICDALGWANNLRQEDLVGAIMTLCRTVTAQSNRIDSLCVEVLKLRGPGHGMTVAEEIAMTPNE